MSDDGRRPVDAERVRALASPSVDRAPLISIVVPLHNEEESLEPLWECVCAVMGRHRLSFELVFVDDGSTDHSLAVLRSLVASDRRVRAIAMRRQFGKAAALATGFQLAAGEWIVTLDADLQDDPEEIPAIVAKLLEGNDVVSGWKRHRHDPLGRRVASRIFNWATRTVSGVRLHDVNCGIKGYSRDCAQELVASCYGEQHRYLPVVAHWKGFRVTEMPVTHHPRRHGSSRYGLERYLRGLLDLVTTVFLSRYARRPMHLFGTLGLLLFVPGCASVVWLMFSKIALGASLANRPLLIIGAIMVIAGLQFILAGLLAEAISRTPDVTAKYVHRTASFPRYFIQTESLPGNGSSLAGAAQIPDTTATWTDPGPTAG